MVVSLRKNAVAILFAALLAAILSVLPGFLYEEDLGRMMSLGSDRTTSPTTIIVTGANSGLGYATVVHLSQKIRENATIVMACWNTEKCLKAKTSIVAAMDSSSSPKKTATLVCMELDLASRSSIESFARDLQDKIPHHHHDDDGEHDATKTTHPPPVHILINNTGFVGHSDVLEYIDGGKIESTVGVNHLGHFFLTHCLWKNLIAAGKARIVAVSSGAALFPLDPIKNMFRSSEEEENKQDSLLPAALKITMQYARSKRANLMFAAELQRRFSNNNISVNAAHPGYTRTEIFSNGWAFAPPWLSGFLARNPFGSLSPEEGALSQVIAALIEGNGDLYVGPKYFLFGEPAVLGRLSGSRHHAPFSRRESAALWDRSLRAVNVSEFGVVPSD